MLTVRPVARSAVPEQSVLGSRRREAVGIPCAPAVGRRIDALGQFDSLGCVVRRVELHDVSDSLCRLAASEPDRAVLSLHDRVVRALALVVHGLQQLGLRSVDDQETAALVDSIHLAVGVHHIARLVVSQAVGAGDELAHGVVLETEREDTIGSAEETLIEVLDSEERSAVGSRRTLCVRDSVDLRNHLHSLGVAYGERRVSGLLVGNTLLLRHDVHLAVGDSGVAARCAQLVSLAVLSESHTILPVALLVEIVDRGFLCAEPSLVEHEHAVGVLLLLCRNRRS